MRSPLTLAVLLLAACGSSTHSTPDAGSVSVDQGCSDIAAARCARYTACAPVVLANRYGDAATCQAREKLACVNGHTAAAVTNGQGSEGCAAALPTWGCADFLLNQNPPTACTPAPGAASDGSSCGFGNQCFSGFCALTHGATCGTCQEPLQAGAPCSDTGQCSPGLLCSANKACAVPATKGTACDSNTPCAVGLRCSKGSCASIDSTVAAGAPCGDVGVKVVDCTAGVCSQNLCVARAADGNACNSATGVPGCVPPAFCVNGTCQLAATNCH